MKKLVFASNNAHKLEEVRSMIPNYEILGLKDINCIDDIPETAMTFEGNASIKADFVSLKFGFDCFSDDSGLEVTALRGEPGVFSARYAGEPTNHGENIKKVLRNLEGENDRRARFITVIALNLEGKKYFFEGVVNGTIISDLRGVSGFGYDPIFVPDGYDVTFAEMSSEQKNSISHRGNAIKKLLNFLEKKG